MNDYDYTILIISIFLGFPVLLGYSKIPKNKLLPRSLLCIKKFYLFLVFCSFISGIYIIWYYIEKIPQKQIWNYDYETRGKYYAYLAFCLFIGSALIWPLGLIYNWNKIFILLGLFITSLASILILSQVSTIQINNIYDILAIFFASVLVFQTLIMDFSVWGSFYLLQNEKKLFFGKKLKLVTKRNNEKLWQQIKKKVLREGKGGKKGQWSARKAQLAVKLYKKRGGTYKDDILPALKYGVSCS